MINLSLTLEDGTKILFVYEVEKLTPEEIHVEVSNAIDKELREERELRTR